MLLRQRRATEWRAPSKDENHERTWRSALHYSSVTGTIEASLPFGQFSLSTTALAGLR